MLRLTDSQVAEARAFHERAIARGTLDVPPVLRIALATAALGTSWDEQLLTAAGANLVAELQRSVFALDDGKWGTTSAAHYRDAVTKRARYVVRGRYPEQVAPGTEELRDAADEACTWLGRPPLSDEEFAALSYIVDRESDGWRARPNYTADGLAIYADRRVDRSKRYSSPANRQAWNVFEQDVRSGSYRSKSSAVGIGQLLGRNYEFYCPVGRSGIGDTVAELAGMIAYCHGRYGGPIPARTFYTLPGCPPDRQSFYSAKALEPDLMCKPGEGY